MRKETRSAMVLMLLILAGTSVAALEIQERFFLASGGKGSPDNPWYVGPAPSDFSSIQEAVFNDSVSSGDTIEVKWSSTPYSEFVLVNKTLIIKDYLQDRMRGDYPTVDGFNLTGAPGTEIDGFIVQQQIYLNSSNNVINNNTANSISIAFGSSNNTLTQNIVSNFDIAVSSALGTQNINESNMLNGKPIYYWVNQHDRRIPVNASYVAIVNSANITAEDLSLGPNYQGLGVLVWNSTAVTIANVSLTNHYTGIRVADSSQVTVKGLNMQSPYSTLSNDGVYFTDVNDSNIQDANFTLDAVGNCPISLDYSWNNTIRHNVVASSITSDAGPMIYLDHSHENIIQDNDLSYNNVGHWGLGIYLFESDYNSIIANNITKQIEGLHLDDWSNGNLVFHNNFLNNSQYQARNMGTDNSFDNGWEGNYWSNYNGNDTNGDGIIDTSYYNENEGVTDNHPLKEPWSENRLYERPVTYLYSRPPDKYIQKMYTFSNCTLGLPQNLPSTAAGFIFNNNTITLNVTCGYSGFLSIRIDRNWTDGPFTVSVDNYTWDNYPYAQDRIFSSMDFTFAAGRHTVKIAGLERRSITGDLNGDGKVNILDAIILGLTFNAQEPNP